MIGNGHVQFCSGRERGNQLPDRNRVRLEGQRPQVPLHPHRIGSRREGAPLTRPICQSIVVLI
jgi:hypothetical protein